MADAPTLEASLARAPGARGQLGLFALEANPLPGPLPAPAPPDLEALAARLPRRLRLGTSSWSFPGWRGCVYAGRALTKTRLARHGLAAYARHPLLRSVGLDRSFYAPLPAQVLAGYAGAVPGDFRFLVKAWRGLTEPGPAFLDPEVATREVVEPCLEGLGRRAGPILFQFPPLEVGALGGPARFAEALHAFLAALPPLPADPDGTFYAVELRNRELFRAEIGAALSATGAAPCLSAHPRTPPLDEQRERLGFRAPARVVRWMLHRAHGYQEARSRYAPFDALVDEDPRTRAQVAAACREALDARASVTVIANNKAEGSAPLTLFALARALDPAR